MNIRTYIKRMLIVLGLVVAVVSSAAQVIQKGGRNIHVPSDAAIKAPKDAQDRARALLSAGHIKEAAAVVQHYRAQFPLDYIFRMLAFDVAFLQGRYEDIPELLKVSDEVAEQYRGHTGLFSSDSYMLNIAAVEFAGIKTGIDPEKLELLLLQTAQARRASLPFGMVDDEGIHADRQVLALLLGYQRFGRNGKLIFERAATLAPNDTFILELKAKRLMDESLTSWSEDKCSQAVEMYKKALKAKASEARIKHLKKELVEAEKKADYIKTINEIRRRRGGG